MAKIIGYEVIALKPVCIDYPDGRVVSFRPGMRFEAHPTNTCVRRLLRSKRLRQLSPYEPVPALPVKLGAPADLRRALEPRKKLTAARRLAALKKKAPAKSVEQMEPVDLSALNKPKKSSRRPKSTD